MHMPPATDDFRKPVRCWLVICCLLLLAMVALGGYTRLTNSGLSITEWKPVTGVIPPLSGQAWQEEFSKYQASPEYQKINKGFGMEAFQRIYWVEWLHRFLGRIIGLIFLLPLLWFIWKRQLSRPLIAKLLAIFVLGGLQGAVGWYMVASGLVDNPHVSHFRLTFHLMMAMLIYGWIVWIALTVTNTHSSVAASENMRQLCAVTVGWVAVQSALGAMVAGLKAGLIHNSFPLMDGGVLPHDMWQLVPWYINLLENPSAVQFLHRASGILLCIFGLTVAWKVQGVDVALRKVACGFALILMVQLILGIITLLLAVPVVLGVVHQVMAFLVLTVALMLYARASGKGRMTCPAKV